MLPLHYWHSARDLYASGRVTVGRCLSWPLFSVSPLLLLGSRLPQLQSVASWGTLALRLPDGERKS